MSNPTKFVYLQFPLFLLRNIFMNPQNTVNSMIDYGLFRYAEKVEPAIADVCEEIKKSHCRTTKQMILCRMFGFRSTAAMEAGIDPIMRPLLEHYRKRYHFDKLKDELEHNWHILNPATASYNRNIA